MVAGEESFDDMKRLRRRGPGVPAVEADFREDIEETADPRSASRMASSCVSRRTCCVSREMTMEKCTLMTRRNSSAKMNRVVVTATAPMACEIHSSRPYHEERTIIPALVAIQSQAYSSLSLRRRTSSRMNANTRMLVTTAKARWRVVIASRSGAAP